MIKVTVSQVMNLNPCEGYTREVVQELWGEKESLALREILDLDIDIEDRVWVLTQSVPIEAAVKWAHHCAATVKFYKDKEASWAADRAAISAAGCARAVRDTEATSWAANTAYLAADVFKHAGADYDKSLYGLLTTLIEMSEEIDEA